MLVKVTPKGAVFITSWGVAAALFPKDQPSATPELVGLVKAACQGMDDSTIVSAAWAVNDQGAPQYDRVSGSHALIMAPAFATLPSSHQHPPS